MTAHPPLPLPPGGTLCTTFGANFALIEDQEESPN